MLALLLQRGTVPQILCAVLYSNKGRTNVFGHSGGCDIVQQCKSLNNIIMDMRLCFIFYNMGTVPIYYRMEKVSRKQRAKFYQVLTTQQSTIMLKPQQHTVILDVTEQLLGILSNKSVTKLIISGTRKHSWSAESSGSGFL